MAARNQTAAGLPRSLFRPLKTDRRGLTVIDLKTNSIEAAQQQITALGGEVVHTSWHNGAIRAKMSVFNLERLAALPEVRSIRPAIPIVTNGVFSRRLPSRPLQQFSLLNSLHLAPFIGSITGQGYIAHAANQVIPGGIDGTGVKIGVISDSALPDRVAALIASGDLPADLTVLPGHQGPSNGTNEGTAMMEVIHDLAPGAKLFFASLYTTDYASDDDIADTIRALRFVYGCDIIVDDVTSVGEPVFQDGVIAQAVNDVSADGALHFSSAGNAGNLTYGTSGTWEGDFEDSGGAGTFVDEAEGGPVRIHDFGQGGTPRLFNTLTSPGSSIGLQWSDATGHSGNDYDLFVFDSTGTVLKDASVDRQTGSQDPFEIVYGENCGTAFALGYCPAVGDRLVVVLFDGTARALHVDTGGGRLAIATGGATYGHHAGLNTVSIAATAWNSGHAAMTAFTGFQNRTESFSSDGPRKIFYRPDGSAITPTNLLFSTNGGATLQKPDLTAADGVFTKTPGFLPFFGTSAAAPHAAAIAALVKSANPFLTNAQIRQILTETALDTMNPGVDRDSGFGITMAAAAVRAAMSAIP
ncbi:MAG: S8 family peptidase [Bryobacteraceae bacterium]